MKISETDFNLLSALIDDELNATDKEQMLKRLQTEEDLQQTFVQLEQLKYSMQASYKQTLTKKTANTTTATPIKRSRFHWPVAASFGVLGVFIALLFTQKDSPETSAAPTLLALHQAFSQATYQVVETRRLQSVKVAADSHLILPDLSQSNLFLVAQQSNSNLEQVMHYRGKNGCKLTLLVQATDNSDLIENSNNGMQQYQWFVADRAYQVIATGMDQQRFTAISQYIEQLSNSVLGLDKYQLAMQNSYKAALPCA